MTDLDRLIERARSATVDRGEAERYVRELDRWARSAPTAPPRRWVPWLVAGVAAAAAVLVVLWWRGDAAIAPATPVQIGNQVAVLAAPGTAYRVVRSDPAATEIAVEHGAVTARLWRTAQPHRLVLSGGGVTAAAVGTVYSLTVGAGGPVVGVVEGTVEVRASDGLHVVHAGSIWPPGGHAADPADARALLALAGPAVAPVLEGADAGIAAAAPPPGDGSDEGADAMTDATSDAAVAAPHPAPATAPAIKDRWRTARLLRGQGQFSAAVTECLAIADARDPTWSPIALVEAVRIELGPLADPERAIALADRAIREWPADALVAEARELRCRALRQLGRGEDCTHAPPP
jgi:hypothetical protein